MEDNFEKDLDSGFENTEIEGKVEADYIKCSSCGGNMVFNPQTQTLYCEYCKSEISFEKDKAVKELDIESAFTAVESWSEAMVLHCENCGADISVSREEVSLSCPYCGTSHVKKTETIAGVKPNAVYPFTICSDEAKQKAKKWAKGRLFSPRKFKKSFDIRELKGVYQPCFTFDSKTISSYNGKLGKRKTRRVKTKNGYTTQTYIDWRWVSGSIARPFDDITISASTKFNQAKLNKLMPFAYDNICEYSKEYLAGFYANHYDKDIKQSWTEAKVIMDKEIERAILQKYNCDVVGHLNVSTIHNDVTYKYVLMPIYAMHYKFKKKNYDVSVNGNTGKVYGKAPISFWRVLIAVLLGVAVLVGIYFLGADETSAQVITNLIC